MSARAVVKPDPDADPNDEAFYDEDGVFYYDNEDEADEEADARLSRTVRVKQEQHAGSSTRGAARALDWAENDAGPSAARSQRTVKMESVAAATSSSSSAAAREQNARGLKRTFSEDGSGGAPSTASSPTKMHASSPATSPTKMPATSPTRSAAASPTTARTEGDTVLSFGKHRGSTFAAVFAADKGYCAWVAGEELTAQEDPESCFARFKRWLQAKQFVAFGKHKGLSYEELLREDPQYCAWLVHEAACKPTAAASTPQSSSSSSSSSPTRRRPDPATDLVKWLRQRGVTPASYASWAPAFSFECCCCTDDYY